MRRIVLPLLIVLGACRTQPKDDDTLGIVEDTGALSGDTDGDGLTGADDCDELDASVHVGAEELCDGVDNDCDGEIDEGVRTTWYRDTDGDGFGDPTNTLEACEPGEGMSSNGSDCNDGNAAVYPGADELCNGIDDNCDGAIDEGGLDTFYRDADGDGHGVPDDSITGCDEVDGYARLDDDCNDADATISPSAEEVCNAEDDDCDGDIDEGVTTIYYADADLDGYGDSAHSTESCDLPPGHTETAGDCDDTDSAVHPAATEVCNAIDDDCDTLIDDADPGLDTTTASTWYADLDSDGYGDPASAVSTCDQPSNTVADATDCDDTDSAVHPAATEVCNTIDDDCDTLVDDDDPGLDTSTATTWANDADGDGYGSATASTLACVQPSGTVTDTTDCDDTDSAVHPAATEVCNAIDDDCDTLIDDDDPGLDTSTASTWYTDADLDGYGDAASTTVACDAPSGSVSDDTDCDDTNDDVNPGATEQCDGIDGDCDGTLSWLEADDDGDGLFACEEAVWLRTDSASNNDPTLSGTYGSSNAAALLTAEGITISTARLATDGLTSSWLDDVGVLVMVGTAADGPLTTTQAADLEAWVDAGGSLVYVGYHHNQDECDQVDSLPAAWGIACDRASVGSVWSGTVTTFTTHPLTTGLSSIVGAGGEYWTVSSPATAVATYSGWPILVSVEPGQGRVIALADEWPFYDAGTGSADISMGDNETMVDNMWTRATDLPLE